MVNFAEVVVSFLAIISFLAILTCIIKWIVTCIPIKENKSFAQSNPCVDDLDSSYYDTNWRQLELNLVGSEPPIYGYYGFGKDGARYSRDEKDNASVTPGGFFSGVNTSDEKPKAAYCLTSSKKSESVVYFDGGVFGGGGDCGGGGGDGGCC